jgi:hypothetical protein
MEELEGLERKMRKRKKTFGRRLIRQSTARAVLLSLLVSCISVTTSVSVVTVFVFLLKSSQALLS